MRRDTAAWVVSLLLILLAALIAMALYRMSATIDAQQHVITEQQARLDHMQYVMRYALDTGDVTLLKEQMLE
ncbi:MAG: hypothetical protein LBC35_05810 [Coriobacteriales bacterium]|nr:hypothetical protein [Coriobacteriales bacterium]